MSFLIILQFQIIQKHAKYNFKSKRIFFLQSTVKVDNFSNKQLPKTIFKGNDLPVPQAFHH